MITTPFHNYPEIRECYERQYEKANFFNYSHMELIPYNDTDVFLNGSMLLMRDIKKSFRVNIYTEQYTQGEWIFRAFNRTYNDFCIAMKNPTEPFFVAFAGQPKCPYKKGVSFIYYHFFLYFFISFFASQTSMIF